MTPIDGSEPCQVCKHSMVQGWDIDAGQPRWVCLAEEWINRLLNG